MSARPFWAASLAWGAFAGMIVSAMTGAWWQFPYWAGATALLTVLLYALMIREALR